MCVLDFCRSGVKVKLCVGHDKHKIIFFLFKICCCVDFTRDNLEKPNKNCIHILSTQIFDSYFFVFL